MFKVFIEISNFPDYFINEEGEIISLKKNKPIKLKPYRGSNGYVMIRLIDKNGIRKHCLIHRLVAKTFIPNPENKQEVNHIDGIKTNNNKSNLEWVTRKENLIHSYDCLNETPIRNFKKCKLYKNNYLLCTFNSTKDACMYAAEFCNISYHSLRKYKKCKEYKLVVE